MDFCSHLSGKILIDEIKNSTEENLVVSPLSFNIILNMTAEGSTDRCLRKVLKFLKFKEIKDLNSASAMMLSIASDDDADEKDTGPIVHCLHGVWLDKKYSLLPSHEELIRNVYKADIKIVDFQNKAAEIIDDANAWAKEATKGLVTDVFHNGNLNAETKLLLANALYFKGNWEENFTIESTENKDFCLLNGGKVSVPFMTGCDTYTCSPLRSLDGFKLVRIPYRKGKNGKLFAMYIFLPHERNGLEMLLQKAASDPTFLRQDFPLINSRYDEFWIPKFKFSYRTAGNVLNTMIELGLPSDFGTMDCVDLNTKWKDKLYVNSIVQKAFIEVDEVGTEAAAVTFEDALGCCLDWEKWEFVADHPFMFMIKEEEMNLVLFTGAVLNPLKQGG